MSTKRLGVVGRGLGRKNSIPTIPTIPTVPTIPTIPTPWGCSKLKHKIEATFSNLKTEVLCFDATSLDPYSRQTNVYPSLSVCGNRSKYQLYYKLRGWPICSF